MNPQQRYARREQNTLEAAPLPFDRPPTRDEVWQYVKTVYEGLKTMEEMIEYARTRWVSNYVYWRCICAWDKHPDWTDGDPVIADAVPRVGDPGGLWLDAGKKNAQLVYGCLQIVRDRIAAERRAA